MFNEAHAAAQRHMPIRDILDRMRHDGCGGRAGKVDSSPALRVRAAGRCGGLCCGKARLGGQNRLRCRPGRNKAENLDGVLCPVTKNTSRDG